MSAPSLPPNRTGPFRASGFPVSGFSGEEKRALRTVPKDGARTSGADPGNCTGLAPPLASPCGHSLRFFVRRSIRHPSTFLRALRSTVVTRFPATTDALTPASRMRGLLAQRTPRHWRVSLIIAGVFPAIPSPTICALAGVRPAASGSGPPRQASSFPSSLLKYSPGEGTGPTQPMISLEIMQAACPHAVVCGVFQQPASRLAHSRRPNRVHGDGPRGPSVLRTGRSRSVAPHPALLRRNYGSIPHDSSPHRSGLPPLHTLAFSGTLGCLALRGAPPAFQRAERIGLRVRRCQRLPRVPRLRLMARTAQRARPHQKMKTVFRCTHSGLRVG